VSTRQIIDAFSDWAAAGRRLALATVFATEGSTYTKAGHRIVIADNGDYRGLVSGGCLEGDLAEHALNVMRSGEPQSITYDLRDEADEIFGLGIGCNGLLKILLQALVPENAWEPFQSIAQAHRERAPAATAVVVESADPELPLGATLLAQGEQRTGWSVPERLLAELEPHLAAAQREHGTALITHEQPGRPYRVLYSPVKPIPRLLVLGAGPDAAPLVRMADLLGWLVTAADHREAYLENPELAPAQARLLMRPDELGQRLALDEFDAVVVMSHHLETDRHYLAQLAATRVPYVGVLGPRLRRNRLLEELGPGALALGERLRGPIGLDIGADTPESIALSVLAEIQQSLP